LSGVGVSEPLFDLASSWLNSSIPPISATYGSRGDFVNKTLEYDHGIDPATGCCILFIYYLFTQLGFSINSIIAAAPGVANASTCLRGVFTNLTGGASDPFPLFKQLLDCAFTPDVPAAIPGPNPDNPWPLRPCEPPSIQATITRTDAAHDIPGTPLPIVTDFSVVGIGFTPAGKVSGVFGTIVADIWGEFSWSARISPNPTFPGFHPRVGKLFSVTDVLTGATVSAGIAFEEG